MSCSARLKSASVDEPDRYDEECELHRCERLASAESAVS